MVILAKKFTKFFFTFIAIFAGPAFADPIDDAVPFIYERCVESFAKPNGLAGEFANTRFSLQPYPAGQGVGVTQAYVHPALGETRVWSSIERSVDSTQYGCTMVVDGGTQLILGGDPDVQFNLIATELGDEVGSDAAAAFRNAIGVFADVPPEGIQTLQTFGDRTLSHVLTRGIPGDPAKGYILSVFFSVPNS